MSIRFEFMSMENTLKVLNQMVVDGVISGYAICGAIAAMRFVEPFQTSDLDVLAVFPQSSQSALGARGYKPVRECIQIGDWPVQFLPVSGALLTEAFDESETVHYGETPTRALGAEYLGLIMLNVGRPKDKVRLA